MGNDKQNNHQYWMEYALTLADKAQQQGEIPVGAVIVKDGEVIGEGWNQSIQLNDPTAHAEIMALRAAGLNQQNYRIVDATIYVTLEPCPMCSGALVHARLDKLVYGASDLKTGCAGSVMNLVNHPQFNHQLDVEAGVEQTRCSEQISHFFKQRRKQKKELKQQLKQQVIQDK